MVTSRRRAATVGVLLLGILIWRPWSRDSAELTTVLTSAEAHLARHDYDAAVRTLESAPAEVRSDERFQVLRARAHAQAREVAAERGKAAPASDSPDALHGFRILIYPRAGSRADEVRAQALGRKLGELVPADVEIRPRTPELMIALGLPHSDEIRYDTSLVLDERAARSLQEILKKAALGDFTLRHGRDRGAGTLYILFAGTPSRQASE